MRKNMLELFFLVILILLSSVSLMFLPKSSDIIIREAFFSKKIDSTDIASLYTEKGLNDFGFKEEKIDFSKRWKLNNRFNYPYTINAKNTLDSAKEIILDFSKTGIMGGCGEKSENLIENIKWVTIGHGCCSDHAQVFMALSILNNIKVRTVSNQTHTCNEIYSNKDKKWIWIDPEFCLLAKTPDGRYLSAIEILNSYMHKTMFTFEFFGNQHQLLYHKPVFPIYEIFGDTTAFKALEYTNGNNLFEVDHWNAELSFLPKTIRQFLLLSLGIKSDYLLYDPLNIKRGELQKIRILGTVFFLFVLILIIQLIVKLRFENLNFTRI